MNCGKRMRAVQSGKPVSEESNTDWRLLAEFKESGAGGRGPMESTLETLRGAGLPPTRFAQIHEAILRSIEDVQKAIPALDPLQFCFRIWVCAPVLVPLQAFIAEDQAGRSWGFFLITRSLPAPESGRRWLIEVFLFLEGGSHESSTC